MPALESTEPRRESRWRRLGGWIVAGMLEAKKPNWISALVGGGIGVEEVAHCLVELALAVLGCGQ